jgi:hypothetical protein
LEKGFDIAIAKEPENSANGVPEIGKQKTAVGTQSDSVGAQCAVVEGPCGKQRLAAVQENSRDSTAPVGCVESTCAMRIGKF